MPSAHLRTSASVSHDTGALAQFLTKHTKEGASAGASAVTATNPSLPHATLWSSNPEFGLDSGDVVVATAAATVTLPPLFPVDAGGSIAASLRPAIPTSVASAGGKKAAEGLYSSGKSATHEAASAVETVVVNADWLLDRCGSRLQELVIPVCTLVRCKVACNWFGCACSRCEQHVLMTGSDVFDVDHLAMTLLSALKSSGGDAGVQTALFEVLGSIEDAGVCVEATSHSCSVVFSS